MKRLLLVEVECGDETCEWCVCKGLHSCGVFPGLAPAVGRYDNEFNRLPRCLEAERRGRETAIGQRWRCPGGEWHPGPPPSKLCVSLVDGKAREIEVEPSVREKGNP